MEILLPATTDHITLFSSHFAGTLEHGRPVLYGVAHVTQHAVQLFFQSLAVCRAHNAVNNVCAIRDPKMKAAQLKLAREALATAMALLERKK